MKTNIGQQRLTDNYSILYKILFATAMVVNVEIDMISSTSLRVSWDRLDIPEITRYIIYYSQTGNSEMVASVDVSVSENSVTIEDLMSNIQYQFEVVGVAEVEGATLMGERSNHVATYTALQCPSQSRLRLYICDPLQENLM